MIGIAAETIEQSKLGAAHILWGQEPGAQRHFGD
jgi:hypothetical protein